MVFRSCVFFASAMLVGLPAHARDPIALTAASETIANVNVVNVGGPHHGKAVARYQRGDFKHIDLDAGANTVVANVNEIDLSSIFGQVRTLRASNVPFNPGVAKDPYEKRVRGGFCRAGNPARRSSHRRHHRKKWHPTADGRAETGRLSGTRSQVRQENDDHHRATQTAMRLPSANAARAESSCPPQTDRGCRFRSRVAPCFHDPKDSR
jgi:hypothetical protein